MQKGKVLLLFVLLLVLGWMLYHPMVLGPSVNESNQLRPTNQRVALFDLVELDGF